MVGNVSLSTADRDRILAAVAAAEQRTSAELVVTVAAASDHYTLYPLAWAGGASLIVGGLLAVLTPRLGIGMGFIVEAAVFVVLGIVLHWLPLRLLLVPARQKRAEAAALARVEFARLVLGRTPDAMGLLLFASLGERCVEIIPDRAIADRIPAAHWQKVIDDLTAALRTGAAVEGFVRAIAACTEILEREFPCGPDDTNHLPDAVVIVPPR
jgi:putative membrane protein